LVEPKYYTRYPPLGLLKLSTYYKSMGAEVKFVRGLEKIFDFKPDKIEITSLFTYSWIQVHETINYYCHQFPSAEITVGGIYASLMPNKIIKEFSNINVQIGLNKNADHLMPDYSILSSVEKWNDWDGSIIFTSRGCVNKCPFCMVPVLEGKMRSVLSDPATRVYEEHSRIIIWDNNFLASKDWKEKLEKLKLTNKWIDFNQGLDARLIDEKKAKALADMKIREFRMAYDGDQEKESVHRAVDYFSDLGVNKRRISFYTLYNFYLEDNVNNDTPESFYRRVLDILNMGCVSYPMRFVPLNADKKNNFVSPNWTAQQLEAVARARRVIGFGGAFPPYAALISKFKNAEGFDEAFKLNPVKEK